MTDAEIEKLGIALRHALHECAEVSGAEKKTKETLLAFLKRWTRMETHPCGGGFYAALRSKHPERPAIALRADMDALSLPTGGAAHLCGHDGHAAALCCAALMAQREEALDRDILFLFQPAEETGEGAARCCELFQMENVGEIYGAHNLPGLPLGQVTTREGTFACSSRGLILRLIGAATHAAYPENGISPAQTVGQVLCALPQWLEKTQYSGMVLCTVIGVRMGQKAFGAAAADAEIYLTLRGEHDGDLEMLENRILTDTARWAVRDRLRFEHSVQDAFPATENPPKYAQKVLRACGGTVLPLPMRWSEDFGHYLHHAPGAFFGIGAGEACPALHTEHYCYPDALLMLTAKAFVRLALA